jgi:NAD(P)-dependent dehydrogenase (short-subunit alcohol dehydrogenase family)
MSEIGTGISFVGQTVVVTGGGNGLGRAYALEFGRRGANVVVNDPGVDPWGRGGDPGPADSVAAEIARAGGSAVACYDSVSSLEGGASIVQSALEAFGDIHAVINNAGNRDPASFADMTEDAFSSVLRTHLYGAFYVSQAAFRVMARRRYGRLVFVSSNTALFGTAGLANYAAAKTAIIGLANVIGVEGAPFGITANVVLPVAPTPRGMSVHGALSTTGLAEHADAPGSPHRADHGQHAYMSPGQIAPLVVALASRPCNRSRRMYSIGYGRIADTFIGVTRGWYPPDVDGFSAEDILAHIWDIENRDDYIAPRSPAEEKESVLWYMSHGHQERA